MFFVDKYYGEFDKIHSYQSIINNIIKSSNNIENIFNPKKINNFQHLIVYGLSSICKQYIVNKILEKLFGKKTIDLQDVEYMISGYSNIKTKITIKQSKYHIVIEPNSNGFDKYLIQEIIQEYAKTNVLNIIKEYQPFKIIVINKIDKLSYYAQAALRRTMEKYSNTCKFILINDQLSNIIEPLRSRCLLVRVPLLKNVDILKIILNICYKENISINTEILSKILFNSNNKINRAIWLLNLYKYNINYKDNWEIIVDNIIKIIINPNNYTAKKLFVIIKNIREQFYILFITNISTLKIIKSIMNKLLKITTNISLKYNIIELTSLYENRLHQGTRHIIHIESYIIKLINIYFNLYKNNI